MTLLLPDRARSLDVTVRWADYAREDPAMPPAEMRVPHAATRTASRRSLTRAARATMPGPRGAPNARPARPTWRRVARAAGSRDAPPRIRSASPRRGRVRLARPPSTRRDSRLPTPPGSRTRRHCRCSWSTSANRSPSAAARMRRSSSVWSSMSPAPRSAAAARSGGAARARHVDDRVGRPRRSPPVPRPSRVRGRPRRVGARRQRPRRSGRGQGSQGRCAHTRRSP